ncbi:hypothetical protein EEL32_00300 (plasmid) [Brevibacillus laterosporus]|nr:hypothetical protein EEL32_00300 [Brevibacillus laterosporus]
MWKPWKMDRHEVMDLLRIIPFLLLNVLKWIVLLPVRLLSRIFVCPIIKHEWVWLGNGFFGFFAPSKPFRCSRCWKGHSGEMDKLFSKRF